MISKRRASVAIAVCLFLAAGAAAEDRVTLTFSKTGGVTPSGATFQPDPDRPQMVIDATVPSMTLEPGPALHSDGLVVSALLRREAIEASGGVVVADRQGFWLRAGLGPDGAGLLESSAAFQIDRSAGDLANGADDRWIAVELEAASSSGRTRWSLRLWPADGERPVEPTLQATMPEPPARDGWRPGVWTGATGRLTVADLTAQTLSSSRLTMSGGGTAWPLRFDGTGIESTAGVAKAAERLELSEIDALRSQAHGFGKCETSFPCNPYLWHFAGAAPQHPGSAAELHLPPLDNDCDGAFNEDGINGYDDDGDGLVDEDSSWCGDGLLNWRSVDDEFGEVVTGDIGAAILVIRVCWPARVEYLAFTTVFDDHWLTGLVRTEPLSGGVARIGRGWSSNKYLLAPMADQPLALEVFEAGAPLVDGTWFDRPATITAATEGGTGTVTVTATVDGLLYELGTPLETEGWHDLVATATDDSETVTIERNFGIDRTPPAVTGVTPVSGSLLATPTIAVAGRVSADTVSVVVAGLTASLGAVEGDDRPFTAGPIALTEGLQALMLIAEDHLGHTTSLELSYDLDTLAPQVTLDSPIDGSLAAATPITVGGAIVEAHLTALTVDGVPADVNGDRFTAEIPLAEGSNTVTAMATDALGRTSSATLTVRLDTTAPQITVDTPPDGTVVDATAADIGGWVADANLASVTVNGIQATVDGDRFTATGVPLTEGPNAIEAVATDQVGNSATSPTIAVVRDTLAPELTIATDQLPDLTAAATVVLTGTVVDPNLSTVTVGGVEAAVSADTWLLEVALTEGDNTFTVRAEDSLGHVTETAPVTVVRDATPPAIAITEPADGGGSDAADVVIRGTVTDAHLDEATVQVNGQEATVSPDGTFELTLTLPEGETTLVATAEDQLGQLGASAPVTIIVDTLLPVVTLIVPVEQLVSTPTVTVLGTIQEPNLASLTVNGIEAVVEDFSFRVDDVPLVEGPNDLVAHAEDTFGHMADSNVVTYVLDTTPPVLTVTEPTDGAIVTGTAVIVAGTADDANLREVTVNGDRVTVIGGAFSTELSLPEGNATITVVATDSLDHIAEVVHAVVRDTFPPSVSIDEPAEDCLPAGQPVTIRGSVADANLATGLNGEPAPVRLEIQTSDGTTAEVLPTIGADGRSWVADAVDLGAADGTALISAVAADRAGRTSRATRSLRMDATAPTLTLFADGQPLAAQPGDTPAPGAEPAILSRAVTLRVQVTDPGGAVPEPVFTVDGSPWAQGARLDVEGDHLLVARATDCAGRESVVHALVRLDLTAPSLLSSSPADGDLLADGPAAFTGTADEPLASANVNGTPAAVDGATFTASPLAWTEATNRVDLELVDAAGHRTTTVVTFTVDTEPPTVQLLESGLPIADGTVFVRAITPEIRVSDPDATLDVTLDGLPWILGALIDADGEHTLTATATDALDRSASASVSFEIDRSEGPSIVITSPVDGETLTELTIDITGTASGRDVSVEVNGQPAAVTGGTWVVPGFELEADTANTLTAQATDDAGRTAFDTVQVMVRSDGPLILVAEPADGAVTARAAVDVAGVVAGGRAATDDGLVTVQPGAGPAVTATLDADGAFRVLDVPLADGVNVITVSATDPQGRLGSTAVSVTSDRQPPTVSVLADGQALDEGAVLPGPTTLQIQVSDVAGAVEHLEIRLNGQIQAGAGELVELPVDDEGGYLLAVETTDGAGNTTRVERSFIIDGGGCSLSRIEPGDGQLLAADSVTVRGAVTEASSVEVRVPVAGGDPQVFPAQLADGTFLVGDVPLGTLGDNPLDIVCLDRVGGESSQRIVVHRVADDDGPVVEITAPASGHALGAHTVSVQGTLSDAQAALSLNGAALTATQVTDVGDGTATFAADVALIEGPNVVVARAVDDLGRSGRDRAIVWRDSRAPAIALISPTDGSMVGLAADGTASVLVAGQVDLSTEQQLPVLEIATGGTTVPVIVDPSTGAFEAIIALDPTDGDQVITVTATDSLGNAGTATVSITVDAQAPTIQLTQPAALQFVAGGVATVTVAGTARGSDGTRVQVNGSWLDPTPDTGQIAWGAAEPDGQRTGTFSIELAVPSDDGSFPVIVRAETQDGRTASEQRLVIRDATAPEAVEIIPADGATAIDPDTLPMALFSEVLDPATLGGADGLRLERLATGETVACELAVAGSAVALVPGTSLSRGETYRFHLGAGLADPAGNAFAAPTTVDFTIAESAAGQAPVLDDLAGVVCASNLSVTGTAAPGATVQASVGDLVFTGFAAADGRFAIPVLLPGEGFHLLRVFTVGRDGSTSPAAEAVVRVDCDGPRVVASALDVDAARITAELSEAVDPATVALGDGVRLTDADSGAAIPATLSLENGDTRIVLTLDAAADAPWRDLNLLLAIGPPVADPQGHLAETFEALLLPGGGGAIAGGYLLGEAFDDATGRPLGGVTASLYTATAALPGTVPAGTESAPIAQDTTDDRGRYRMLGEVAAGRYALVLSAPGYAPAVRRLALEPAAGVVPFDARLTPLAEAAGELDPISGATLGHPATAGLTLVADPAAVPGADLLIAVLTPRSGQSLPDLLPLGWTPVAAAECALETAGGVALDESVAFAAGGVRLDLPLPAWVEVSDALVAVRHRLGSGVWVALGEPQRVDVDGATVARLEIPGPGAYAVVLADAENGPVAPAVGEALAAAPTPEAVPDFTASLVLDPPVVSPTGRATARVVAASADGVTAWPSGLAVQAYLQEQLVLSDGGQLLEAPFAADLLLYHPRLSAEEQGTAAAAAAGAAEFIVSPSERAAQVLLEVGWEDITVYPFPDQLERGLLLGSAGGAVTSPDGIEVELPEGALPERTVVRAARLSADDLAALPTVPGFDTLAAVRLEWDGHTLAREATVRLPEPDATPEAIAGDPRLILAEWMELAADGRGGYARLASRIQRLPAAGGQTARLEAAPEAADSTLPVQGITREGLYLVLWAQQPLAYATGLVSQPSGAALAGARVTADGLGTADLSRSGGRYAAPIPAGGSILTALHPTLDEQAEATTPTVAPATVVAIDLMVQPTPPTIEGLSPADGEVDVPVGSQVSVLFSEPLDPATVGAATLRLELANADGTGSGAFVRGAVTLTDADRRILFSPDLSLPPGRTYIAHFGGGVRDAGGVLSLEGPLTWSFATAVVVVPGGQVRPELFRVLIPENGQTQVWAEPGALPVVPEGQTPWAVSPLLVNDGVYPTTVPTHSVDTVGGLAPITLGTPDHPATIHSEIWVRVFDPTSTLATTFRVGPFVATDGLGFVADPDQDTTFTTADEIVVEVPGGAFDEATIVRVTSLDPSTIGIEPGGDLVAAAHLNVEFDGQASESLVFRIPAPVGAGEDDIILVGSGASTAWGARLSLQDLGGVVEQDGRRYITNDLAAQPNIAGVSKSTGACDTFNRIDASGDFVWYHPSLADIELASIPVGSWGGGGAFVNISLDQWVYEPPAGNWCSRVVLPVVDGEPVIVESRDVATGWLVTSQNYGDPADLDGDGVHFLETLEGPLPGPPRLLAASPFHLIPFAAPGEGEEERLRLDLTAVGGSQGHVTLRDDPSLPLPVGSNVALYGVRDPEAAKVLIGPTPVCGGGFTASFSNLDEQDRDHLLAVVGPTRLEGTALQPFVFHFSTAITADLEAASDLDQFVTITEQGPVGECNSAGDTGAVSFELERVNSNQTLIVRPLAGIQSGRRYELELKTWNLFTGTGQCPNQGNESRLCGGPRKFHFATRELPGQPLAESQTANGHMKDLLTVGNLAFIATDRGVIQAIDLSGGANPTTGELPVHATLFTGITRSARNLVTDGHRRVFTTQEVAGIWVIRSIAVEDVEATPPGGTFNPREGALRVALALGAYPEGFGQAIGLASLPRGSITDFEVVTTDITGEDLEITQICDEPGDGVSNCTLSPTVDPDGFHTLDLELTTHGYVPYPTYPSCLPEGSSPRYQRVSVDNVSTGETWSVDIEPGGTAPISLRARPGDRLQVRHNTRTLGVMSIIGSGITVVDLNLLYDRDTTQYNSRDGSTCGRRIGTYQGSDINPDAVACGQFHARPGIDMTTSVAPVPGIAGRGLGQINVFSPLMHEGVVQTSASEFTPGSLAFRDIECLDRGVQMPPSGNSVRLHDVVVAPSTAWVDQGVRGGEPGQPFTVDPNAVLTERHGELLFVSLNEGGILVYDIGSGAFGPRSLDRPIGHLWVEGHNAHRLQVVPELGILLAGGYGGLLDVWDLRSVNTAPGLEGVAAPKPAMTLRGVPWKGDHLGVDLTGTGLIYVGRDMGDTSRVDAVPLSRAQPVIAGVYRAEENEEEPPQDPPPEDQPVPRELRPTEILVPLGVPTEYSQSAEHDNREDNERDHTAAFKVRLALPGFMPDTITTTVETLMVRPPDEHMGTDDLGPARVMPGGPGWPDARIEVELRRIAAGDDNRFGTLQNLYESDQIVLLVADPRAMQDYEPQGAVEEGSDDPPDIASEAGQCRRCEWPEVLTDDEIQNDLVTPLLAGGPYLRVRLKVEDDPDLDALFDDQNYPIPAAVIELAGWADDVPSPAQVSLAEPVLNPAMWSPGEGGVAVSLVSGEAIHGTTDHAVSGRALGFAFSRAYRSGMATYNALGRGGWTASLFAHLQENAITGELAYHDGSGHVWRFYPQESRSNGPELPGGGADGDFWAVADAYDVDDPGVEGAYIPPKGLYVTLMRQSTGFGWILLDPHNNAMRFDSRGRLIEIADRLRQNAEEGQIQGNRVRLSYDAFSRLARVIDDYGRQYDFTHHDDADDEATFGLLEKFEDFADRTVAYEYDSQNSGQRVLDKVVLPEVTEGSIDGGAGELAVTYTYDGADYGDDAILHGELAGTRLEGYRPPGRQTNLVGLDWDGSGRIQAVDPPRTQRTYGLTYTPPAGPFHEATVTSPKGEMTTYFMETSGADRGRASSVSRTGAGFVLDSWMPPAGGGAPVLSHAARVINLEYEEDGSGRISSITRPDGSVTKATYRAGTRLQSASVEKTSIEGATDTFETTIEYQGPDNLPSSARDQIGRIARFPAQAGSSDPATDYWHGSAGDPNGPDVGTTLGFSETGTLTRAIAGVGQGKSGTGTGVNLTFSYNANLPQGVEGEGYIDKVLRQDGVSRAFGGYTPAGLPRTLEFNPAGAESGGLRTTLEYDAWDRPFKVAYGDGAGAGTQLNVERRFDPSGRLKELIRNNHLIGSVARTYEYDADDRLERVTQDAVGDAGGGTAGSLTTRFDDRDGDGLTDAITSTTGIETFLNHDEAGRLENISLPMAAGASDRTVIHRGYDVMGRLVYTSDGHDGWWRARYDDLGRLAEEHYSDGTTVKSDYNPSSGDLERVKVLGPEAAPDLDNVLAEFELDVNALGGIREMRELNLQIGDGVGMRRTTVDRDNSGRMTEMRVGGQRRRFTYATDGSGHLEQIVDSAGNRRVFEYGDGRWVSRVIVTEPDGDDENTTSSFTLNRDARGRITDVIRRSAGSESPSFHLQRRYDAFSNVTQENIATSAHSRQFDYRWDGWGRPLSVSEVGRSFTLYGYDGDGRLKTIQTTASEGSPTSWDTVFDLDDQGNVRRRTLPGAPTETFTYYPDGTVRTWTTRQQNEGASDQLTLGFEYDAGNRVLRRAVENPEAFEGAALPDGLAPFTEFGDRYAYDDLGRVTAHRRIAQLGNDTDPDVTEEFSALEFDYAIAEGATDPRVLIRREKLGRWGSVPGVSDELRREFDELGRMTSLVGNIGPRLILAYDDLDRRQSVGQEGVESVGLGQYYATYRWGGADRFAGLSVGGLHQEYAYLDPNDGPGHLLSSIETRFVGESGPVLGAMDFTWAEGSAVKIGRSVSTPESLFQEMDWVWGSDERHRLTAATSGDRSWDFGFAGIDEAEQIIDHLGRIIEPEGGVNGRLEALVVTEGGDTVSEDFAYDESTGRRITDGLHAYLWNWRGELVEVEVLAGADAGSRVTYRYDADGRLIDRTAYNPVGAEVSRRGFLWNGWELTGQVGLNSSDEVLWRMEHLPGPVGLDDSPQMRITAFQGLWHDPTTGLAYARNRWYDARTASWLSEDPLGPVDSPNLYAFVAWGPHLYRDPFGLETAAKALGVRGEWFLAQKLRKLGWTVLLGPDVHLWNQPGADIFAVNLKTGEVAFFDDKNWIRKSVSKSGVKALWKNFDISRNIEQALKAIEESDLDEDSKRRFRRKLRFGQFDKVVTAAAPEAQTVGISKSAEKEMIKFMDVSKVEVPDPGPNSGIPDVPKSRTRAIRMRSGGKAPFLIAVVGICFAEDPAYAFGEAIDPVSMVTGGCSEFITDEEAEQIMIENAFLAALYERLECESTSGCSDADEVPLIPAHEVSNTYLESLRSEGWIEVGSSVGAGTQ
jgi:RHS repeat-associated protein